MAREELELEKDIVLQILGCVEKDSNLLVWFMTGNECQAHTYYPIQFVVRPDGTYRLYDVSLPVERGFDCYVVPSWKDGYCFFTDNPECNALSITYNDKTEGIPVTSVPFVYYHEGLPSSYSFLDADENVIL